jgi:hypothetical protein
MKFKSCAISVSFILLSFLTSPAYCEPPRDERTYQNRLEADAWKRRIEKNVVRQQAHEKPPVAADITWKEYWVSWYSFLRQPNRGLPWKGSEFKTSEDMIRYVKGRLKAHGLPTYE